jgi:hypothetical protein
MHRNHKGELPPAMIIAAFKDKKFCPKFFVINL